MMQNLTLTSALTGVLLLSAMGLAQAAGGNGIEGHQSISQMRGYTAQVGSEPLVTGRSVSTGDARFTTCQLPEPAISPNGIASLSNIATCR